MRNRTKLILDCICLVLLAPVLGMMIGGLVLGVLKAAVLTLGIPALILADAELDVFEDRWHYVATAGLILSAIVALVWSGFDVRRRVQEFRRETKQEDYPGD